MKKLTILLLILVTVSATQAQLQLKPAGVKWDASYSFEKSNEFVMEFYARNNELMRTMHYNTYYNPDNENFLVKLVNNGRGTGMETVLDKKNMVAIQIMGTGGETKPYYNAGGFKYPEGDEIKMLEIIPTTETREILGFTCRKYTYTYKKVFGEVWITDQVKLSNDLGIFRAAKMAALHNTLSIGGFVMEMTSEDAKGGKTLMKTVSLQHDEKYTVDLTGVEMNTAINKVNYFTF